MDMTLLWLFAGALIALFTVSIFYWKGQERGYDHGYAEGFADAASIHRDHWKDTHPQGTKGTKPVNDIQAVWDDPPAWEDVERDS